MRIRCLLALLLLSVVWFASVVAAISPPIARCTPYRKDVSKYVGKAQGRGTTADWAAIRGGDTTSLRRVALAAQRRQETNQFVLVNAVIYAGLCRYDQVGGFEVRSSCQCVCLLWMARAVG
jgi:hypothetical protein